LKNIYELEQQLLPVVVNMEFNGVYVAKSIINRIQQSIESELTPIKNRIYEIANEEFNINSERLKYIIFEVLQIPDKLNIKGKKTAKGNISLDKEYLEKLSEDPFIQLVLEYRELDKLCTSFTTKLTKAISPITNKIHSSFNQLAPGTGRFSSSDPNLQQIPSRSEVGKIIRSAFVSRFEEGKILAGDMSQAEIRILAHMSNEEVFIDAFHSKLDPYKLAASKILQKDYKKIKKEERTLFKTITLALIYGMEEYKMSKSLKITVEQAKESRNRYLSELPYVNNYIKVTKQEIILKGYSTTLLGRKRYFPDTTTNSSYRIAKCLRQGVNASIQGSCADMIKVAMVNIHNKLKKRKAKSCMIMQVHDELVFDVHPDELSWMKDLVNYEIANSIKLKVPIEVDCKYGNSWGEAH
jgi:DNA polymerase-1